MRRFALRRMMPIALAFVVLQLTPAPASAHYGCDFRTYLVTGHGPLWAQASFDCDRTHYTYRARLWVQVRIDGVWTKIADTDDGLQTYDFENDDHPIFASDVTPCIVIGNRDTFYYRSHVHTMYSVSTTGNIAHRINDVSGVMRQVDADTCTV
jgi:hypothetical protein